MATYREAWSLFQDEPNFPPRSNRIRTMTTDQNTTTTTLSKAELISELRRLRRDLQELQSASNPNPNPQISDRPEPSTSTTQPDNSVPHRDHGSEKSETARCWESCCNGRLFSNRSNLIRHQRERRGESAKLPCSFCDAVFLRSSARNAHEVLLSSE